VETLIIRASAVRPCAFSGTDAIRASVAESPCQGGFPVRTTLTSMAVLAPAGWCRPQ
jgi:hypothetical protein